VLHGIVVILQTLVFLADLGEEVWPQDSSNGNVWKDRLEFYHSAQPKDEEEEDEMIRRAIAESQKLEEERQRQILDETASRVRQLYAFFIFLERYFCVVYYQDGVKKIVMQHSRGFFENLLDLA